MAECKLFQGHTNYKGYGMKRVGPDILYAHRLAWIKKRGPIPVGMLVLHTCDVPDCVQDDDEGVYVLNGVEHPRQGHLWLGTNQDNMDDKVAKGRQSRCSGTLNGCAKITEDDVRSIRSRYAAGERQWNIADTFGITQAAVSLITRRKKWAHVQ